jgi:hypothetical protein
LQLVVPILLQLVVEVAVEAVMVVMEAQAVIL